MIVRKLPTRILIALGISLLFASTTEMMWAAEAANQTWAGQYVRRVRTIETSQLSQALGVLFGRSEVKIDADARITGIGPLLLNQFSAVDFPREEYRLPSGRLISSTSAAPKRTSPVPKQ